MRAALAIAVVAISIVAAACGGSDEGATATTAPTTTAPATTGPTTTEPTTVAPTTTVAVDLRDGDLLGADDFSDPNGGWGSEVTADGEAGYARDAYRIFVKRAGRQIGRHLQGRKVEGMRVEVRAKQVAGTSGDALGIKCFTDVAADEGYMLVVAPADRRFGIFSFANDSFQVIDGQNGPPVEGIRGVGKTNHLVALCVHIPGDPGTNFLTLAVNGQDVGQAFDERFTGGFEAFGMVVDSVNGGADGRFDDLIAVELVPH
jgi:hypothetical protein